MNATKRKDRTEYLRLWHLRNRARRVLESRANYQKNRDKKLAASKLYAKLHPDIRKKAYRNYRQRNPDLCRQRNRDWYARNREGQQSRSRRKAQKDYSENKEKILCRNRAWAARNKDKIRLRDLRRKALLKGARINLAHMEEWIASIKAKRIVHCYWCDKPTSTKLIHFDHIIPLSKGGAHSVENLCVSCEACNCSKQAKSVTAWVRLGQQTLAL